jgi:ATP-dependent RNA circularization protein (DNA/RNA ligase family)
LDKKYRNLLLFLTRPDCFKYADQEYADRFFRFLEHTTVDVQLIDESYEEDGSISVTIVQDLHEFTDRHVTAGIETWMESDGPGSLAEAVYVKLDNTNRSVIEAYKLKDIRPLSVDPTNVESPFSEKGRIIKLLLKLKATKEGTILKEEASTYVDKSFAEHQKK